MIKTISMTENYVPSTDTTLPSFGLVLDHRTVTLVFDEDTPMMCQETVHEIVESHVFGEDSFIGSTQESLHMIRKCVHDALLHLVGVGHLRQNSFNNTWVWIGDV